MCAKKKAALVPKTFQAGVERDYRGVSLPADRIPAKLFLGPDIESEFSREENDDWLRSATGQKWIDCSTYTIVEATNEDYIYRIWKGDTNHYRAKYCCSWQNPELTQTVLDKADCEAWGLEELEDIEPIRDRIDKTLLALAVDRAKLGHIQAYSFAEVPGRSRVYAGAAGEPNGVLPQHLCLHFETGRVELRSDWSLVASFTYYRF